MARYFRAHRLLAIAVLIGAGAWVATGEFSAVGSEEGAPGESAAPPAGAAEPAPVRRTVAAMEPHFADHAREIRVSGSTAADKRATLAARANGVVAGLGVRDGEMIAKDAIVLQLEGADVTADVANAEVNLEQRVRELEVAEKLFARGNFPELQLTAARSAKAAAEAQLKSAQAAADRLNLRAPFSGIVDEVLVEQGEWVQAGTPIATLLSLDPIVVKAEVSELDVSQVQVGDTARVRLASGGEFEGRVRQVASEANPATRTFAIEIGLPNPGNEIPAGMTAQVTLFAAPVRAVTVPRSVITLSEDGVIGVRVLDGDNTAGFAPVTVIDDTPEGLVVSGVPEGVRIVTAGQDLIRNGDVVDVVDAAALSAGQAAAATDGGSP